MKVRQKVFDTYWNLAAKRQEIFFGKPTSDPILKHYKFCNTYRACDRVSQFLIRDVIYAKQTSPEDTLFRIFLFRLFNKIETWKSLERLISQISLNTFGFNKYARLFEKLPRPIYGNAFILCANKAFGYSQKHLNHLKLLKTVNWQDLIDSQSLEELFLKLKNLPLIGDFMAYQLAIDFNYSEVFTFDENDFTVAGPGAIRGIKKCFTDLDGTSYPEVIKYMVKMQDQEFARLGLKFRNLYDRKLHCIDCQGLFCETDKYCRVKFPRLVSNRVHIKTKYIANLNKITYFYPPKWKLLTS